MIQANKDIRYFAHQILRDIELKENKLEAKYILSLLKIKLKNICKST